MIAAVLIAALACVALAYVARPLIAGPRREPDDLSRALEEAEERKRTALIAIIDIEEERDLGKLSEEDFQALRGQYEAQALAALRELDALVADEAAADGLEAEIARRRAEIACPNCGAIRTGTVCIKCGESS